MRTFKLMLLGNSLYTKAIKTAQVCVESRASLTEIPQEEKIAKMQSILDHHRSFLKREGESESFRPKKRWRLSVQKVLAMFDNQLRVSFSPLGLKCFPKPALMLSLQVLHRSGLDFPMSQIREGTW